MTHDPDLSAALRDAVHLCVDMQRLFAEDTDWHTPWMKRVSPNVAAIVAARPSDTVFTRFIPARTAREAPGAWRRYYERWDSMTLERLAPGMVDLMPALAPFVPPARVIDKTVYSPWVEPDLDRLLRGRGCTTLIVSGGETDVCVLASVLGAVDRGYRVVVASDALCSSSDEVHDAAMALYHNRFSQQVMTVPTEVLLSHWNGAV